MKLLDHFKTFMADEVNLNQTRITLLEKSIEAVENAIRGSDWGPEIVEFAPQGSWAHDTIIKPVSGGEFDADLLVFVKHQDGWSAKDYVNTLATTLGNLKTYEGKVRRYSHCATIEYAGERRIDIAPCVVDRQYAGQVEVCNRGTDKFEASAPKQYTLWVRNKNSIAGGNDLKKVTRLLKYMRDIKGNFTCPSFLFTTLLGMQVNNADKDSAGFADLPTTLKTVIGRLDNWLQANSTVPYVQNPVLSSENQASGWSVTQYQNFRDKINLYRGWIDEAYDEADRDESIGKWQRVFGDKFAAGEASEAARVSESIVKSDGAVIVAGQYLDLVDMVKRKGAQAIPTRMRKLPYMLRPPWRRGSGSITVSINTELYGNKQSVRVRQVQSMESLPKGFWLKFTAVGPYGGVLPGEYKVKWRITNTDAAAIAAGQLRGDFYDSESGMSRMEQLSYRGVHLVEAFVLRRSDDRLVGQSAPFYVVIE